MPADLPAYLPLDVASLARIRRLVETEWPGERGVARAHGLDPERVSVEVEPTGTLRCFVAPFAPATSGRACSAALEYLARRLEDDLCVVVDRSSGVRVVGWATAKAYTGPVTTARVFDGRVRIVDLDIDDPRRSAFSEALGPR